MASDKKNSGWLAFQFIAALIFSFLTLKLNLITYGEKQFGIWVLFTAFWGIGSIIDFGFGTAIIKFIAGAKSENNNELVNKIASTGLFMFVVLGIIIVICGNVAAEFIYYNNPHIIAPINQLFYKKIFLLLSISFYFQYCSIYFRSLFEGLGNFVFTSKCTLLYNLVILLFIVIIYILKASLIYLAIANVIASFLLMIVYIIFILIKNKYLLIRFNLFDLKQARSMFGFSISVQAASLLGGIIDPIVKYIIGNYVSLSIVTYYEVARRFSTAVSGLFNTAFKTILPKSSILKNKLEYSNFIKNEGIKLTKIGVSYSGFIFGCLSLFFVLLIKIWFGYEQSILIFFILGLAESVNIAGYMIFSFFMGIGKSVYLVFLQGLFLALVYIILIMGFTIFHNLLGLIGFFVASFLVNTIQLFLLKDQTGVSILYYLKKTNMIKLISLHLLILMSIILTFNHVTNVYITFGILSLISSRLFIKEIKDYGKQVLSLSRNSFGKMMQ